MKKILVIAVAVVLSGCVVTQSRDLTTNQDKLDIARCAGTSNPDLSTFTVAQYEAYARCIIELNKRRKAVS